MIKEPLFHFLMAGLLIFTYFEFLPNTTTFKTESREIVIDDRKIQRLSESWEQTWRRPPNEQELENLIENAVREEVYYREALQLGLDQNDSVVRNRMVQKMRYLHSEELPEPTHDDLISTLKQSDGKYDSQSLYSFQQIYLGQRYDASAAKELVSKLNTALLTPDDIRKPLSRPHSFVNDSITHITRQFGVKFSTTISSDSALQSEWFGPVTSGFGSHLVKINQVQAGSTASLTNKSVMQRVENDWRAEQGKALEDRIFLKLRQNYTVEILRSE